MSEQAERFYSEMYSIQGNRISWGEYIARLYDTDEIELLTEQEIVRCRDCKHYRAWIKGAKPECWANGEPFDVEPDGFCAWGTKTEFVTCKCGEDIERIGRIQTCPSCGRKVMA